MKLRIALLAAMATLLHPQVQAQQFPYKNSTLPTEKRVNDLLTRMTVEEKVGQLSKLLGSCDQSPKR